LIETIKVLMSHRSGCLDDSWGRYIFPCRLVDFTPGERPVFTVQAADESAAWLTERFKTIAEKQMVVFIGGKPAAVSYAGLAPGLAGVYQINVTIPDGVGPGDVYFDIDGVPAGYTTLTTVRIGR
jgi:uncharacterized protein (TIGR03437 family)